MENSSLPRSLTILTRSTETKDSHDSMRRESSIPSEHDSIDGQQSLASSVTRVNPWPTHSLLFIPPSSRPSTPPPDDISPSQVDLIHGVGDHFSMPFSRASTLSVNSGYDASISSLGRTPDRDADSDDEDLETPRALQGPSFRTPARDIPTRDCIVVQLTPDQTPRVARKRGTSPLSTPRPAKRSRPPPPQEPLSASLALQDALQRPVGRSASGFRGERLGCDDVDDANPHVLTHVKITTEWFSLAELEAHLSALLASYRALNPDPDPDLPPSPTKQNRNDARAVRHALEDLFGGIHMRCPGDDEEGDFFLEEEEEDLLDLFMTRVRDLEIPAAPRVEWVLDMLLAREGCLTEGVKGMGRFVKRVTFDLSPFSFGGWVGGRELGFGGGEE